MTFLANLDPGEAVVDLAISTLAHVTVVITVAALVSLGLRHRAEGRHTLWLGVLFWVLLSPFVSILAQRTGFVFWTVPIRQSGSNDDIVPRVPQLLDQGIPTAIDLPVIATRPTATAAGSVPAQTIHQPRAESPVIQRFAGYAGAFRISLLLVWVLGTLIGLARIAHGWRRLAAFYRDTRPLDPKLHAAPLAQVRAALGVAVLPPIVTSPRVSEPAAIGLFRPRIVLPEGLDLALSSSSLRQILVHECAHIFRSDLLVGLLQRLVAAVFWPHPLVHYSNGQLALAREEVCDNHVLRLGDRFDYARTLLALTEICRPSAEPRPGLGLLDARWTLADRIAGLLDPRRAAMTRTSLRVRIALALAITMTGLTAACLRFDRPARANEPRSKQTESPATVQNAPSEEAWHVEGSVVDEQRKTVTGATICSVPNDGAPDQARSAADGSFALALRQDRPFIRGLVAEADGGARIGLARFENARDPGSREPVTIVLKPSRQVTVRVRDADGAPVPGAAVEAIDFSFQTHAVTGADGKATLRVAADTRVQWLIGRKSGAGFDYFENSPTRPVAELPPLPAEVTLTLDGAQTVRIKAIDSKGQPVPGVAFSPWILTKPGRITHANMFRSAILRVVTGADGVAEFDWYPTNASGTRFLIRSGPYTCPESPRLELERGGPTALTCRLLRDTRLSGVVRFADGRPAQEVLVRAQGSPGGVSKSIVAARSGKDGTYNLEVPPERSYMVAIDDESWAAPSLPNVVVREGQSQVGLDFRLTKGTLIRGQVTAGADHRPEAGAEVSLVEEGGPLPKDERRAGRLKLQLTRRSITDAQGRYHFRVGPGSYWLMPPLLSGKASLPIVVKTEADIVQDLALEGSARETSFTGIVIEKTPAGERPVADARVFKIGAGSSGVMSATDGQGRFRMVRTPGEHLLYARAEPGGLAGFAPLPEKPENVRVVVSPSTTVSGRVVDSNGKPLARQMVGIALASGRDDFLKSFYFGFGITTDEKGRFTVNGATVGSVGEISVYHGKVAGLATPRTAVKFEVPDLEPVQIPDLVIPPEKPVK